MLLRHLLAVYSENLVQKRRVSQNEVVFFFLLKKRLNVILPMLI